MIPNMSRRFAELPAPFRRFQGMKVLVTGDSITEKNSRAELNWHDYLKDWFGWGEVKNDGKSGSGLVKNNGIVYRLDNWLSKYGSVDMILLMGNMNDGTSTETADPSWLGTFDDDDDSMKDKSLYGALHYTCKRIIEMYPTVPFGWIISPPRRQVGDQGLCWGIDGWFEEWTKAIKKVCGHYSVPVLDLYHESGLRPWNPVNDATFFSSDGSPNGDGIHPNSLGQKVLAHRIYTFILQYM